MNRRSANAYDSDDSESDWDTTAAESPTKPNLAFSDVHTQEEPDGDYATVKPMPRTLKLQGSDTSTSPPQTTPRKDVPKRKEEVFSPPPHLNSFKNALSDYSDVYEPAPNVPPKLYADDDKGEVYAVPDTDRDTPQVTVNWDDSDADEQVLQELRHNRAREKDRQRQEAKGGGDKHQQQQQYHQQQQNQQQLSAKSLSAADNRGFEPSPKHESSTNQSVLEHWARQHSDASALHSQNGSDKRGVVGRSTKPDKHKRMKTRKPALLPVTVQDAQGKKCVFYFEDSNLHMLEVVDDDVGAFLPDKIEEVELLYRRVWRETFSILRIITSFFVLFITELLSFITHHVLRPLVLDTTTSLGNHFVKPLTTILFNMILRPVFALLWNIFNALLMAADPFVQLLGAVCSKIAILLQSIQLFHVTYHSHHPGSDWRQPEVV